MSEIQQGDHVTIGVGPKVWYVESVGSIAKRAPIARLRDPQWTRITMPLDTLTKRATDDG